MLASLSQVFPGNKTTVSNFKPIFSPFSDFSGKRLFPNIFNKCVGTASLWLWLSGFVSPALLRSNHVSRTRGYLSRVTYCYLRSEHHLWEPEEEVINFAWAKGWNRVHQMEKWRRQFPGIRKIVDRKHGCFWTEWRVHGGRVFAAPLRRIIQAV